MAFTHDFSSVQALPFANGTAVFDDAFPGARATVLTGGPEQSEVIYDGGFVRTRPNDCLHKVGEEQVTTRARPGRSTIWPRASRRCVACGPAST